MNLWLAVADAEAGAKLLLAFSGPGQFEEAMVHGGVKTIGGVVAAEIAG